jgi:hypothetical protein
MQIALDFEAFSYLSYGIKKAMIRVGAYRAIFYVLFKRGRSFSTRWFLKHWTGFMGYWKMVVEA